MALFDIDKNNDDRSTPKPNSHDPLLPSAVMSKGTNSVNYITPASQISTLSGGKNGQFTIVQTGNFTTTATYTTSTPSANQFSSDTFTIFTQPHNLGFVPGILAYEQSGSGQYSAMPYTRYQASGGTLALWYTFLIYVDATNVFVQLQTINYGNANWAFQPGFIFKWYLMQQTGN